jgi:lipopolysaccharide export system permease protein
VIRSDRSQQPQTEDSTKRLSQDSTKRLAQDSTKRPHQDSSKKASAAGGGGAAQSDSVMVIVNGNFIKVARNNIPPDAVFADGSPAGANAIKAAADSAARNPHPPRPVPVPGAATVTPGAAITPTPGVVPNAGANVPNAVPGATPTPGPAVSVGTTTGTVSSQPELTDAHLRLDEARHSRNRYGVEIQKKFSLAAACIVFVLVGAPIALRFPRGGVGLVIGVSFAVFAVYYVGLIGGESLANKNIVSPFWAMWIDNILFFLVGVALITRMGNEGVTGRGGNFGEMLDTARAWFARRTERRAQPEVQERRAI